MYKSFLICKIIFCTCLLFISNAFAEFTFDQWSAENGLPHNSVRQIVQTPDGYLWFITFDGLVRFDGVAFTIFNSINTKEITDNRFYGVFVAEDGTVWASMLNGSILRYKNEKFESFQTNNQSEKTVLGDTFIKFDLGLNDKVLIKVRRNQRINGFYLENGKLVPASKEYIDKKFSPYHSPSGKIWNITENGIIENDIDKTTEYALTLKINWRKIAYNTFTYFEDSKGALWVGDFEYIYKLSDGKIEKFSPFVENEVEEKKSIAYLQPQIEDSDGSILFTHKIKDLFKIKRIKDGKVEAFEKDGISMLFSVPYLFKDQENFIWVGSDKGLHRLRTHFIKTLSLENNLFGNRVYSIFQRKNGEILMGVKKGLNVYKDSKLSTIIDEGGTRAFEEDEKGRLWIGRYLPDIIDKDIEKNLFIYENGELRDVSRLAKGLVNVIKSDKNGTMWVGAEEGLFEIRDEKLIRQYTLKNGLNNVGIKFIHESKDGSFWLGTAGGIAKFKDGKILKTYTTEDGLSGNRIRTIYEDSDGTLWIGTYANGLNRFKNGKFFKYTTNDGLYHNGVFQIFEDDRENFWIGGNQGIYRVAKKELNDYATGKLNRLNSFGYGKEDGMLNVEVNGGRQPAGIKASDGRFWFPTMGGVAIIDPKNVEYNKNVPKALIEDVTIEREKTEFRDGLKVGVGKDDVEIHYTAPSFIKPKQIRFKYKLEGFNNDWIEAGTRRTAYYSYLPPGNYTFRLLVANSDGVWNEQETTLNIKVVAPFYRTNWFYALVILSIIGIAFLLYRNRINQLEKRNVEQMAFSQQLISLQEDERKRIAAGLHDSLGQHLIIIKNWAMLALGVMDKKSPAREQVNEISDTSLQALEEVREIINDLRPHQIETAGLTETIKTMIEQVESASGINFDLEYDKIDHLFNKEDEVTFYRIIQEYINNIVKHSDATNAFVSIRNGSNAIKVKIFDDGDGFKLEDSKLNKNGFGLTGIEERLKMLGGIQTIKTELSEGVIINIRIELK